MSDDALDLLSLREAATVAERSPDTLRRWVRAGKLTRHVGDPTPGGGSAPLRIDRVELVALLVASEQAPRTAGAPSQSPEGVGVHPVQTPASTPLPTPGSMPTPLGAAGPVHVARLEGELALARTREELAAVRGELATARASMAAVEVRADAAERRAGDLAHQLGQAREDLEDWRARHDGAQAELSALRASQALSWWRRLLPGPGE